MKAINGIVIMTALMLAFNSCNNTPQVNKTQYIQDFQAFIANTDTTYLNLNDVEREKSDIRFNELKIEYNSFSKDMSEDEREEVDKLIGHYYSCLAKYKASKAHAGLKRLYHQAEGFVENLTK